MLCRYGALGVRQPGDDRRRVRVSPHGYFEYEAAHVTVQKATSAIKPEKKLQPIPRRAYFCLTGCLKKRGELDGTPDVVEFAQ